MARHLLIAAAALLCLTLAGCDDGQVTQLTDQVQQLQHQLQQQYGVAKAQIEVEQRAVAMVEACDAFVPVCSASATAPGRNLLRQGIPPDPTAYDVLITAKFFSIVLVSVGTVALFWLLAARLLMPSLERLDEARDTVRSAREEQQRILREASADRAKAEQETARSRADLQRISERIEASKAELAALDEEREKKTADLAKIEKEIESKRAAAAAIGTLFRKQK